MDKYQQQLINTLIGSRIVSNSNTVIIRMIDNQKLHLSLDMRTKLN